MWKAAAGTQIKFSDQGNNDDDWETDPDFVNDVSEEEQRWGSTTIEGSGRTAGAIDMEKLRRETEEADAMKKKKELIEGANSSFGYGGKFGVEKDRMDKSALGHDHIEKLQKHASQKDYATGFGGKFGVQTDRVDKSAVSWDHKEKIEKHASQKDYTSGFGGKFGVQLDRQDKSALGWDHVEKVDKHESQKDYTVGFGGKFGVQKDRQDKSAVGWDHHEAPQKHESQTDHKVGFGGKFGVQTDRMDRSAVRYEEEQGRVGTTYDRVKPDIGSAKPSEMRARFETMSSQEDSKPPSVTSSPAPKKNVHPKAMMFANQSDESEPTTPIARTAPKQLDQSKTAFLTQNTQPEVANSPERTPGQLDKTKLTQFTESSKNEEDGDRRTKVREEIEQLKQMQQQKVEESEDVQVEDSEEQVYDEVSEATATQQPTPTPDEIQEDEIVDTGLTAVALYDYQAGADDEISFDPEDIITHVEMIDEGWWRGLCKGRYGLFPANYVQLQQR